MNGLNPMSGMTKKVNLSRVVERINNFLSPSKHACFIISLIRNLFVETQMRDNDLLCQHRVYESFG